MFLKLSNNLNILQHFYQVFIFDVKCTTKIYILSILTKLKDELLKNYHSLILADQLKMKNITKIEKVIPQKEPFLVLI